MTPLEYVKQQVNEVQLAASMPFVLHLCRTHIEDLCCTHGGIFSVRYIGSQDLWDLNLKIPAKKISLRKRGKTEFACLKLMIEDLSILSLPYINQQRK